MCFSIETHWKSDIVGARRLDSDSKDASSSENGVDIAETNTPETSFIGVEDTGAKALKKKAQVSLEFMK